ncbi:hypothetical protein PsYK624_073690 [Phanerochaete sordida]|uniref:Uncharacterized protein n=1 Tax=Phanerochaete sordida TaxID=48140 RepID=A0A9P3GAV4_9APHY|nr:hypothetical protein PsYK624_073690 [Phanerochaete sordida]
MLTPAELRKNIQMNNLISGQNSSWVEELNPHLGDVRPDQRHSSQLAIAAKYAKTTLCTQLFWEHGSLAVLQQLTSTWACIQALTVAGTGPVAMYHLQRTTAFSESLRVGLTTTFKYTEPSATPAEGLPYILGALDSAGQAHPSRTACAILHCSSSGRALACFYSRRLGLYIVFDPSPPRRIPEAKQGGPTFFVHNKWTRAMGCIRELFIGEPVESLSPGVLASARGRDLVEAYIVTARA